MTRITFLVDGYNLYHSLREAEQRLPGVSLRWLDLRAFAHSFLELVARDARLEEVVYFSALARHRETVRPGTIERHRAYLAALATSGVSIELGHFKKKLFRCAHCRQRTPVFEEKETDVSIAGRLFEGFQQDACDAAVLVTGDSDLAAAIRSANRLFPAKRIFVVFPFARTSDELRSVATAHFKSSANHFRRHQFPDGLTGPDGKRIAKPSEW